jgi:hypothetical protein
MKDARLKDAATRNDFSIAVQRAKSGQPLALAQHGVSEGSNHIDALDPPCRPITVRAA